MNDPSSIPPTDEETPAPKAANFLSQMETLIRRHPVTAALTTLGFGCAVGIVARELLTPPPPRHRALQILEDIQSRLSDIAEPAYDRASDLADDGISAVKRGLNAVSHTSLGHRLLHLFS
ncbi:hypothetical protein [Prosthecobacter sp.]|uniref:hypothetical protein n=1 Tax=Prosthecobacter sp. TaxID=1965333 RepID=UPI0037840891